MTEFTIGIASVPDRENLVAEIWFGDKQWGELSFEGGRLELEIFPPSTGRTWRVDPDGLREAIAEAKRQLIGAG